MLRDHLKKSKELNNVAVWYLVCQLMFPQGQFWYNLIHKHNMGSQVLVRALAIKYLLGLVGSQNIKSILPSCVISIQGKCNNQTCGGLIHSVSSRDGRMEFLQGTDSFWLYLNILAFLVICSFEMVPCSLHRSRWQFLYVRHRPVF